MLNNPEPKKKKLVLATGNAGKVQEMDSVLADLGFEVISQRDLNVEDAIEDGLSFVENSLIKSRHLLVAQLVKRLPQILKKMIIAHEIPPDLGALPDLLCF